MKMGGSCSEAAFGMEYGGYKGVGSSGGEEGEALGD